MKIGCEIVGWEVLQECPAAVRVSSDGATLLLNARKLLRYTPFERRFVVAHELGHLLMNTANESIADAFALGLLAGTVRNSLRGCVSALGKVDVPPSRLKRLLRMAVMMDIRMPKASIDHIV